MAVALESTDKIVRKYLRVVASKPFTYEGETIEPVRTVISPLLFRGYTCPAACGGCCPRFELVYLPSEVHPYELEPFTVRINGVPRILFRDPQRDHSDHHCRNLEKETGRCGIWTKRPFSCDFELIRAIMSEKRARLMTRLFGRGWQFLRVDGQRGALCEITAVDDASIADAIRKLTRLKEWADYLGVETHLQTILEWCHDPERRQQPLLLNEHLEA